MQLRTDLVRVCCTDTHTIARASQATVSPVATGPSPHQFIAKSATPPDLRLDSRTAHGATMAFHPCSAAHSTKLSISPRFTLTSCANTMCAFVASSTLFKPCELFALMVSNTGASCWRPADFALVEASLAVASAARALLAAGHDSQEMGSTAGVALQGLARQPAQWLVTQRHVKLRRTPCALSLGTLCT